MREFSLFSLNYSDRHSEKLYCPQALGRLPEITYLTNCSFTPKIVRYAKIVQCGDLGLNGSHLPPPSGCAVQNGVQTVFDVAVPLCCGVLSSCWALGGLSVPVFGLGVVCQCPVSFHFSAPSAKHNRRMLQTHCSDFLHTLI